MKPGARHILAGKWTTLLAASLLTAYLLPASGCSFFSSDAKAPAAPEGAGKVTEVKDPFAEGVLKAVAFFAPPNSPAQFLARIAEQLGWEAEIAQNTLLRNAVVQGQFAEKVEPYLISVFFNKGFSVLPAVGEGHQFSRDSIVQGAVADSTFQVATRERVRIIFLSPAQNIQIIYPQDGTQPQLFTPKDGGSVTVRKSLLKQYLR